MPKSLKVPNMELNHLGGKGHALILIFGTGSSDVGRGAVMREDWEQFGTGCSDAGRCAVRFHGVRLGECAVRKRFGGCAVRQEGVQLEFWGCSEVIKCAVGRESMQLGAIKKKAHAPPPSLIGCIPC